MNDQLPDLRLRQLDNTITSTAMAIILSNRGQHYLRFGIYPRAIEWYGLALLYLSARNVPTWMYYWPRTVKGLEASMLVAFQIDDLKMFGADFRECIGRLPALETEYASELLHKLVTRYAAI